MYIFILQIKCLWNAASMPGHAPGLISVSFGSAEGTRVSLREHKCAPSLVGTGVMDERALCAQSNAKSHRTGVRATEAPTAKSGRAPQQGPRRRRPEGETRVAGGAGRARVGGVGVAGRGRSQRRGQQGRNVGVQGQMAGRYTLWAGSGVPARERSWVLV